MNHLLSAADIAPNDLDRVFAAASRADRLFEDYSECFKGKILSLYFETESIRTSLSFASAFCRLGGNTLDLSESVFKNSRNESMRDIVKLLGYYCDAIVARTKSESSIEEFARNSEVPIISAGHGKCEHPTVGMGHLFSIWKSIGHLSGLSILVIAKLPKRGVNSMVRLLGRYEDVRLIFLTSPCGRLPSDVERPFKHGIGNELRYVSGLDEIDDLKKIDAIVIDDSERDYVDKVGSPDYWNPSFDKFVLDTFRDDVILTAGLPRTRLLPADMDEDPRCRHLTKSRDSFHIRAAILLFVLGQLK